MVKFKLKMKRKVNGEMANSYFVSAIVKNVVQIKVPLGTNSVVKAVNKSFNVNFHCTVYYINPNIFWGDFILFFSLFKYICKSWTFL